MEDKEEEYTKTKQVVQQQEGLEDDISYLKPTCLPKDYSWKKCPKDVKKAQRYKVDKKNNCIVTLTAGLFVDASCSPVIGDKPLPSHRIVSWGIKLRNNNGAIFIGVAPSDINLNKDVNNYKCGWYFHCGDSTLWSGPPHNYILKKYGTRKEYDGEYVHTGDKVGVVMDTKKGELSFVVNGVNLSIAYDGIPLDKPLVPCVILYYKGDSVELITSEVKEAQSEAVGVPTAIHMEAREQWEPLVLAWDAVKEASFYQIEVDGSRCWEMSKTAQFEKCGLHPETEHSFRVRAVCGNKVGGWSEPVKVMVPKAPPFSECVWRPWSDAATFIAEYSVDPEVRRIATTTNDKCSLKSVAIGDTPLPPNKVTSWFILMRSTAHGVDLCVGVASSDLFQSKSSTFSNSEWYFNCYDSTLWSGPPHNYKYPGKKYGPRKGDGEYVRSGDRVGVVMDTAKGELSFVLDGVNLGVAYEGIPLDKPLVPCVIFGCQEDSVELIFN